MTDPVRVNVNVPAALWRRFYEVARANHRSRSHFGYPLMVAGIAHWRPCFWQRRALGARDAAGTTPALGVSRLGDANETTPRCLPGTELRRRGSKPPEGLRAPSLRRRAALGIPGGQQVTPPTPAKLYEQTGGGDAYQVAMLEHGYTQPTEPSLREPSGKRILQCGLTHEENWSEWRVYRHGGYEFEGRWCRTCGTTQAREIQEDARV